MPGVTRPSDVLQLIVRLFILDVHDQPARRVLEGDLYAVPFAELLPQGVPVPRRVLMVDPLRRAGMGVAL